MAAVLGTLVQSYYHLPDEVFSNPRPLAALTQVSSPAILSARSQVLCMRSKFLFAEG